MQDVEGSTPEVFFTRLTKSINRKTKIEKTLDLEIKSHIMLKSRK